MKKTYIFYSVLVISALSINFIAEVPLNSSPTQTNRTNSLSFVVAKILYARGLESDAAIEISENFFKDSGEEFHVMLKNIVNRCSILSEDEIMNYISSLALQKKSIQLDSYSALVDMVQKIKNIAPSKAVLKELEIIASVNFTYSRQIA